MTTIALIIIISLFSIPIYILYRNERVFKFRNSIIDEDWEVACENIEKGIYTGYPTQYDKLPSYDSMVLSFKSLTKENWLKDENKL